jgi:hypothetical protein
MASQIAPASLKQQRPCKRAGSIYDRDREVSECSVNAEGEKARLSVREGAEYVSQGQQEHGRAAVVSGYWWKK